MTRPAAADDLTAVSRLLRDAGRRFIGYSGGELPGLLAGAPAVLLFAGETLIGAAVAGWPADGICWIRALALADGVPVGQGMQRLLPPFHEALQARGVGRVFYSGDLAPDSWLQPLLPVFGYERVTAVVVYEKRDLEIPSYGNQTVRVRRAQAVDLAAVAAIDRACFAPEWSKDEAILGSALTNAPYFVVAEQDGAPVGYAFASVHFGGRLVHLVRIAVLPALQGGAIGVRLLAEVVAFARAAGADTLTLNTQIDNHTAQRLYEWFGFARTGEQQTVLARRL